LIAATMQLQAQTGLYGPETPPPKGASISYTGTASDGQVGFVGGKTFTFQAVSLAATTNVFWTMIENSVYLSMNGGAPYTDDEILDYNAAASNLAGGVVMWDGATQINVSNGVSYTPRALLSRFVMTVTSGGSPVNLTDPVSMDLSAQCGGVAPITGYGMVLTVKFEMFVSDNGGASWIPHLVYYNNAETPPNEEGAYSGFNYGFYWENDPPELSENNGANVDEGDTVYINQTMLAATDVESSNEMLRFVFDPEYNETLPAHGQFIKDDEVMQPYDSISMEELINSTISYIHDGSETTEDSIPFKIVDSDDVEALIDGETVFYFMLNITPVDDPPSLDTKTGGEVTEGESLTLDETLLKFTDPESGPAAVTYTVDPAGDSDYPMHGMLKLNAVPLGDGGTFTQADIAAGKVVYSHDGTESLTDGFAFQVQDEFGHLADNDGSDLFFFDISIETVNDDPVITKLMTLELDEGGTGIVSNMVLAASDEESPAADIMFTLDPNSELEEPNFGDVYLDGVLLNDGESFSMADINSNLVTYVHDGSENFSDFFLFNVSDPNGGIAHDGEFTLFHFNLAMNPVNDPPEVANPIPDMTTRSGEAFSYTFPENTFADPDEGDALTYAAKMPGGEPLPDWLMLDAGTRTFSGTPLVADMGVVTVILVAMDEEVAETSDTFDIKVIEPVSTGNIPLDEALDIGPNPFTDLLHISIRKRVSTPVNLTIYNMLGEEINIPEKRESGRITLSMENTGSGIYFIRIEAEAETVVKKVVKR